MRGDHILFDGLSFYSVTGTEMTLNVSDGVGIFRTIMNGARNLGFKSCTVQAQRMYGSRPARMPSVTRLR
jgi:hypothetical protein